MLSARWHLATAEQRFERNPAAGNPAFDRSHRATANVGCLLVSEASRSNQDQRLSLRLGKMKQGALHVAKLDMAVLTSGRSEDF